MQNRYVKEDTEETDTRFERENDMAIKVMLVDDEAHIRLILRRVIERNPAFCVVSECDSMTDALLAFHETQPEVVFMDIEIKGSSGIDCAKVIAQSAPDTKIIFATAYSEYMSNAFELYAFDYLVKPFDMERIQHTLERIQRSYESQHQGGRKNDMDAVNNINDSNGNNNGGSVKDNIGDTDSINICQNQNLSEVPSGSKKTDIPSEKAREKLHEKDKILIKGKESVRFFDKDGIIFVERENNATILYTADAEPFTTSMAISELEEKLSDTGFLRSHKSYLINVSKIKSIEPYGRWTYVVKFKGTQKDALITKEHFEEIKQIYG